MAAALVPFAMKDVAELLDEDQKELLDRCNNHSGNNNGHTNVSFNKGIGRNDPVLDLRAVSGCCLKHLSRGGHLASRNRAR